MNIAKVFEGIPPRQCRYWVEVAGVRVAFYDHQWPTEAQKIVDEINAALNPLLDAAEKMAEFGDHKLGCGYEIDGQKCSCGYLKAKAAYQSAKGKP